MTKNKKAKLPKENKFSISLSGSSVPTMLQEQMKEKEITGAQLLHGLQDWFFRWPKKDQDDFINDCSKISVGKTKTASSPEIEDEINNFVEYIEENSDNPKQDIAALRQKIKRSNGLNLGYGK